MADAGVPWSVAGSVGTALTATVGVLWRALGTTRREEREACAKAIAAVESRVAKLERDVQDAHAKAARDVEEWRSRWVREVERGVQLHAAPPPPGPPARPPAPSFDENTEVRRVRTAVEQRALEKELESYVNSSKPPPKMPSRK